MWRTRTPLFTDRTDAGRRLAERLGHLRGRDAVVLGLPRGGVPVAVEVARSLAAPLDVVVVRKIGVPSQPEVAMGAVGEGGVQVLDERTVQWAGVQRGELAAIEERERGEVERRAVRFRAGRPAASLRGRTALLVDDGIATGATARAACAVVRAQGPERVVLAVPVCAPRAAELLRGEVDELVVLETPADFAAVGEAYADFRPVPDEEVVALLHRALGVAGPEHRSPGGGEGRRRRGRRRSGPSGRPPHRPRERAGPGGVRARQRQQPAQSPQPARRRGAAGGRPRHPAVRPARSGRGGRPGQGLRDRPAGRAPGRGRRLAARPAGVPGLPLGYFGASTGAAAALWSAAEPGSEVAAVVSRGGRPDLAGPRLGAVRAPTLLVVGGRDDVVLGLNEAAAARLRCEHRLAVVPGATHLFQEPGTLDVAAKLARDWFLAHLHLAARHDG